MVLHNTQDILVVRRRDLSGRRWWSSRPRS